MIDPEERQAILDVEHLRLLRIGYLLQGAMYAIASAFGTIYCVIGLILMIVAPHSDGRNGDPRLIGGFMVILGIALALGLAAFGGLLLYAARCLRLRQSRGLCLVAATLTCLQIPIGTAIGISTFMVLGRRGVRAMFDSGAASAPPPSLASRAPGAPGAQAGPPRAF
jgi:hypothetical protein